jgi:hypothetical protein
VRREGGVWLIELCGMTDVLQILLFIFSSSQLLKEAQK